MVIQFDSSWGSNVASPCAALSLKLFCRRQVFCQFGAKIHIILEIAKRFGRKKANLRFIEQRKVTLLLLNSSGNTKECPTDRNLTNLHKSNKYAYKWA